jgi:hypothetical protein
MSDAQSLVDAWSVRAASCDSAAHALLGSAQDIESDLQRMSAQEVVSEHGISTYYHPDQLNEETYRETVISKIRWYKKTAAGKAKESLRLYSWCRIVQGLIDAAK